MRHNAIVLYVLTGRYTWQTYIAVVFEQVMQHLFMLNLTWGVLYDQGAVTDCSNLPCEIREDLKMFCVYDVP
jgi:hypothetical protein